MRRSLFIAVLLAGLHGVALAGGHPVTMWLAEGVSNRVYLLGSVHLLRANDHPLPAVMEAAYQDAERLIMELDMDDLEPAALQATTRALGVIADERTLRDLMGPRLYDAAAEAAREIDIPFDMLEKTEPWYAAITIEQLALIRLGFNPMYGVEMHMTAKATRDGKAIDGLETVEEQLAFLDGLSLDAQNELLMQTLADGKNIAALMDELIFAWRNGDIDYMEDTMLEDFAQNSELYGSIVVDRNHRWADAIEELLDDTDDYLVVVGALHLVGQHGIPALLGKRGIEAGQLHESF